MSMHNIASQLQTAGRGQDSMLVHMTPREVGGLQALAMAHGGSLTINPHTGLPEAGFLSTILPMVAGFALGPAGLGMSALGAGLTVGAASTLATGSLQKGLMAGLGAYGGAGITGALAESGAAGLVPEAVASNLGAAQDLGQISNAVQQPFVQQSALQNAASTVQPSLTEGVAAPFAQNPSGAIVPEQLRNLEMSQIAQNSIQTPAINPAAENLKQTRNAAKALNIGDTFGDRVSNMGKGFSNLFEDSEAGNALRSDLWKNHRKEVIAAGMSALSGMTPKAPTYKDPVYPEWDPEYRAYRTYNPSDRAPGSTAERMYFADGGLMGLAGGGGPVETMSMQNQMGSQQGFPMAQQQNNAYTVSSSSPISGEVLSSGVDAAVNPYTGETRFASGGKTEVYTPKYSGYDYSTGQWILNTPKATYEPYTSLPRLSNQKAITTADLVTNQFKRIYGRDPTADELANYVNHSYSEKQLYKQLTNKNPAFKVKDNWDANELTNYFQAVLGRAPTQEELAKFTNPNKQFRFKNIYKYATKQPEYLKLLNTAGQKAFEEEQAKLEETAHPRTLVTPTGIASTYKDVFGKPPTMEQLKEYQGADITQQELKDKLMGTDEYLTKLTKPFIPTVQRDPATGLASIEGALNAPQPMNTGMSNFYSAMNSQLGQQMNAYAPPAPVPLDAGYAAGGLSHLGDYSDGGRLLKGPGDGVSDSIPAVIGNRQPARLADGEFVVPARIVSELGNGSTEAGAKRLYAMMDRIQRARRKTVGKGKVAQDTNAEKYLPA